MLIEKAMRNRDLPTQGIFDLSISRRSLFLTLGFTLNLQLQGSEHLVFHFYFDFDPWIPDVFFDRHVSCYVFANNERVNSTRHHQ